MVLYELFGEIVIDKFAFDEFILFSLFVYFGMVLLAYMDYKFKVNKYKKELTN